MIALLESVIKVDFICLNFSFMLRFGQFNWTEFEGEFWYCQVVFDAETSEEAGLVPPADDSNPSTGGCGPFSWSKLIPLSND